MKDVLLQTLLRRTTHRDLVIVREDALLRELRVSPDVLRSAIHELEKTRLFEILSPLPFLVLKWSGKSEKSSDSGEGAYSFQSSLSQSKQLKESYRQPVVDETLLQEVLDTLGENDPTTFRGAILRYPPGVIRTALARVRKMKNIQKNPTAVFRFLLPRIANEPAFKK